MKRRAKRLLNDLDQEVREHIELVTQENMADASQTSCMIPPALSRVRVPNLAV
jgi:hypothetical protein